MAAHKRAAPAASMPTKALTGRRAILKRAKVAKVVKFFNLSTHRSTRASKKTWEVVRLENGLVSMEKTPPWMVDVVQRNATESPLLRLPGEIRNKIWLYAMTGNIVNIREDEDETRVDPETMEKVVVVCKGHTVGSFGKDNPVRWLSTRYEDKPRLPTAFHLPEVCRQIYAETATLAYSGTIFFLCTWDDEGELMKEWTSTLTPAHKATITDVAIDEMNFDCYLEEYTATSFKLRKIFPGLQRLHLNTNRANTVYDLQGHYENDKNFWRHQLKRLEEQKQKRVDKLEGGAVQLVWHKNSVEEYSMWEDTDVESNAGSIATSDDESSEDESVEENTGLTWNIHTNEDSDDDDNGETDYEIHDEDEIANSAYEGSDYDSDDLDYLDYDSEMLDI